MKLLTNEMINQISSSFGVTLYLSEMNKVYTLSENIAQKLLLTTWQVSDEISKILQEHSEYEGLFFKEREDNPIFGPSYKIVRDGVYVLLTHFKEINTWKAINDYVHAFSAVDTEMRKVINGKFETTAKSKDKISKEQPWEKICSDLDERIAKLEGAINGLQKCVQLNKEYTVKVSFSDTVEEVITESPVLAEEQQVEEPVEEKSADTLCEKLEKVLPFGDELVNPQGEVPFTPELKHEAVEDVKKENNIADGVANFLDNLIKEYNQSDYEAEQQRRDFLAANPDPVTLSTLAKAINKYAETRKITDFYCSGNYLGEYCSREKKLIFDDTKDYRKKVPVGEYVTWFKHRGGSTPCVTQVGADKLWSEMINLMNNNTYVEKGFCKGRQRDIFVSNLTAEGLDLDGEPFDKSARKRRK